MYMSSLVLQKRAGFTIIELLIIVVVIGILAAITIASFNGVQNRSKNVRAHVQARQAANVLKSYYTVFGTYPAFARDRICLGSNYPDLNADGVTGDCQDGPGGVSCSGPCVFTNTSAFDSAIATIGTFPGSSTFQTGVAVPTSYTGPMFSKPNVGTALPVAAYAVHYFQYGTSCPTGSLSGEVYGNVVWCAISLE
jgi:type II secretory pathway pseudopilin PulG